MSSNTDLKLNYNENFNIVALTKYSYVKKVVNINKLISENICI